MDGITLLESGTSRAHFALVKRLESAKSPSIADQIVREALGQAKNALVDKSSTATAEASLCAQLLVLLHCAGAYPHAAGGSRDVLDFSFALVPALTLLSIAKHARGLQIAYSMLDLLLGPARSHISSDEDIASASLLLYNTMRAHLSGSITSNRQPRKKPATQPSSSLQNARTYMALRSIIAGVPSGAEAVPAFHGPVLSLIAHPDRGTSALAVRAMLVLQSYRNEEEDKGLARAVWEDIRRACASKASSSGRSRVRGGHADEESTQRALLLAAKGAYTQQILTVDEYVDVMLDVLTSRPSSPWLKARSVRYLMQARSKAMTDISAETLRKLVAWMTSCIKEEAHLPFLVDVAAFLGQNAEVMIAEDTSAPLLREVWSQCISHLQSHNPNRRVLAMRILEDMLPCRWADANPLFLLSEEDMARLLNSLSDVDRTIRQRVLRLLGRVQDGLLHAHLDALQRSLSTLTEEADVEDAVVRAVEVISVLSHVRGSVDDDTIGTRYARRIVALLDNSVDSKQVATHVIQAVVSDVHAIDSAHERCEAVQSLVVHAQQSRSAGLSATLTMLLPMLICEVLERGQNPEIRGIHADLLARMSNMLANVYAQAAIQEAWLVSMIKLAALCAQTTVQATLNFFSDFSKQSESISVKERLGQLAYMARDERSEQLSRDLRPLSLLSTLDIVDAFMRQNYTSSSRAEEGESNSSTKDSAKPLRYDEYDCPSFLGGSGSTPKRGPFRTMPRPSSIRSQLLQDNLKREKLEMEMQQTVARLTLQEEETGERMDGEEGSLI